MIPTQRLRDLITYTGNGSITKTELLTALTNAETALGIPVTQAVSENEFLYPDEV